MISWTLVTTEIIHLILLELLLLVGIAILLMPVHLFTTCHLFFLCLTNCSFIGTYFVLLSYTQNSPPVAQKRCEHQQDQVADLCMCVIPLHSSETVPHYCSIVSLRSVVSLHFYAHKFKCVIVIQPVAHQEIPRESSRILSQLSLTINYDRFV